MPETLKQIQIVIPSIIAIIALAVGGILTLEYLRPEHDNLPLIMIIIGVVTPTMASILALLKTQETKAVVEETKGAVAETKATVAATKMQVEETKSKIEKTQEQVQENMVRLDGRLTQLLASTKAHAHAEGKAEAAAEAREIAKTLLETQAEAKEKVTKDKADADAKILQVENERAVQSDKDRNTE